MNCHRDIVDKCLLSAKNGVIFYLTVYQAFLLVLTRQIRN